MQTQTQFTSSDRKERWKEEFSRFGVFPHVLLMRSGDRASFNLETLETSGRAIVLGECVSVPGWPDPFRSILPPLLFRFQLLGTGTLDWESRVEGKNRNFVGLMAGGSAAPSPTQVRELFKALLREARKFSNYNVREYVKRRTVDAFQEHRDASDPAAIVAAYEYGIKQLEIAKRQAIVYNLYAPSVKSIMDLKIKPSSA